MIANRDVAVITRPTHVIPTGCRIGTQSELIEF